MAATKLTETAVKRLRPREARYERLDGNGLTLVVYPTGAKLWRHAYKLGAQRFKLTIGRYPDVSLAEARSRVAVQKEQLRGGINPAEKPEQPDVRTVAAAFQDYWANAPHKGTKTLAERQRLVEKDVLPKLGHQDIATIKRRQLLLLLEEVKARGAPVVANRLREVLQSFFRWALLREEIESDPSAGLPDMKVEKPRETVVSVDELAQLWKVLAGEVERGKGAKPLSEAVVNALQLIMLTGCRTADARGARWSEITGDTWTIPSERFKSGAAHTVYLSTQAQAVLHQAKAVARGSGYVFPSPKTTDDGDRPLGDKSLIQALRRINNGAYSVHDIRRSVATHMGDELHVEPHVIERVLGHAPPRLQQTYNRAGYQQPARNAWAGWGEFLLARVAGEEPGGTVVAFPVAADA